MKKIKWLVMLLLPVVLSASLILTGCGGTDDDGDKESSTSAETVDEEETKQEIKNPETFIDASLNTIETLDIHFMSSAATTHIAFNMYDSLLDSTTDGVLSPSLSTEVPTEENGLIVKKADGSIDISFPIRKGVTFHNGGDLTPEDVKYTFMRGIIVGSLSNIAQALTGEGTFTNLIDNVGLEAAYAELDGAITIDGDNVVFTLEKAFSPFLNIISDGGSQMGIMDKEWCIEHGAWPGTLDTVEENLALTDETNPLHKKINGTGPFQYDSWQPGERLVFERYDGYWKEPAKIERVIRLIVTDKNTAIQQLQRGDVDFVALDLAELQQIEGMEGITTVKNMPTSQLIKINMNFDIHGDKYTGNGELGADGAPADLFSDIDVRKAFCYAFDYDTFIDEVMLGAAIKPYGPVLVGFPTANPDNPQYYFDMEKAEEHFKKAFDGELWEKGFKLGVVFNEGSNHRQRSLEILQDSLKKINPKFVLEISSLPWAAYVSGIEDKEMAISIFGLLPKYSHPYATISGHMYSDGSYADRESYIDLAKEKYDSLIEELSQTFDTDRMKEISWTLQEYSYDDALSIFHYQVIGQVAMRDWVQGYEVMPFPFMVDYYKISKGY